MYKRSRRSSKYAKKGTRRKAPSRKYSSRKSARRPKRTFKRRVLSASTRKKKDVLINGTGPPDGGGVALSEAQIGADQIDQYIPTCPTFRPILANGDAKYVRQMQSIFFVGFKENLWITITGGTPFHHRRVVFSTTDRITRAALPGNPVNGIMWQGSAFSLLDGTNVALDIEILFEGLFNLDWSDPMLASIDTNKIKVWSDTRQTYNSGNDDSGRSRLISRWTPVKRAVIYDDEEAGYRADIDNSQVGNQSSPWSVDKGGVMGNLYVYNFFRSASTSDDTLRIRTEAKVYWHER
jgi:hypothetical protein